jgi:ribulose-5-phosphate 4-epimerase/fuculose-1-phosphate aldolase
MEQAAVTENEPRDLIVEFGKSIFDRGLTAGSSGNISVRLDDGWLLTPTNASLGRLDPGRISKLDWDGRLVSGDQPSKEAPLHLAIYQERPSAGAVVHLHSTYSAAVSCLRSLPPDNCLPPLTAYFVMKIGRLPLVPYHRPGDPRIGDAIRSLAARNSAVLLANHGPVVSGTSLEAAVYAVEELEETAKMFLLLQGQQTNPLDPEKIRELIKVFELDLES